MAQPATKSRASAVSGQDRPPPKKRGPKAKAPSAPRIARTTPVLKNSVFRSREKKLAVLTWIVQTRYPCAPLHPGRAGLVTEFGWRAPTDQEAADFFKIPATTINSWWRNRDVIMNQPKGSRIVRPRKKKEEEEEEEANAEREASNESEFTTSGLDSSGVDSGMAIDVTEEGSPVSQAPGAPPRPTFLSTLNTVVSFHPEPPPPKRTQLWPQNGHVSEPSSPPAPIHQAIAPFPSIPTPSTPKFNSAMSPDAPRGFRAHINTLTAPPPRQTALAEQLPPLHQTENVRIVYPEAPPSATIEKTTPEFATPRGLQLPPPVVPQYPLFPTF
jgi:hypothetical protein